jgi:glucans biosynthesis protein
MSFPIGIHNARAKGSFRFLRRIFVTFFLCLLFCLFPFGNMLHPTLEAKQLFGFQSVINKANELSKKSYDENDGKVPDFLLNISYDNWRDIRFNPDHALWRKDKLLFTAQFFHPGLYYKKRVKIHVIDSSGVNEIQFSPDLFDYGGTNLKAKVPADLGFAGFRLHYPINKLDYHDEVVVFLGASYLRAVGQKMNYGISARGLAIDTALSRGEEFPYFKEFWLVKPSAGARHITVYALLDSPSLTGAYKYIIYPWKETLMRVTSRIFMRRSVDKLGIAPLTSMFFYGENTNQPPVDDFRPEVHDSDGLMFATGSGEWIWRPLKNPRSLFVTSFQDTNPVGFGLIQRDRHFAHYQDLESHYESRPSVWVAPVGNWGEGHLELIQIPLVASEINDNIVAFWVPSNLSESKQSFTFAYELNWHLSGRTRPPLGRVIATRTARPKKNITKFVIDFVGERLQSLPPDSPLTAVITVDPKAILVEQQLYKNRVTKGWRLVFQISIEESSPVDLLLPPDRKPALELRAFLKLNESKLTETWSYAYLP